MEARANHLWVGAVTLALLAALAIAIIWIAEIGKGDQDEYDIFYKQSVGGLTKGSTVSFSGVPVGQVTDIELSDPEFVRVRIEIDGDVPILVGTVATIQPSLTGVSSILLDGAKKGAPEISCTKDKDGKIWTVCRDGVPELPPGKGGLGELVASVPLILERTATVTDRLNQLLNDENQEQIAGILRNSNRLSGGLADATPELVANLRDFRGAIAEFNQTMESLQQLSSSTEGLLESESKAITSELKGTLARANAAADALTKTIESTRPVTDELQNNTLPAAEATLQDLRTTSRSLRAITERLEQDGIGSLVGSPALPDYEPDKKGN